MNVIIVETEDGITHSFESEADINKIANPNTRDAVQAAYDRGDWEPYEPPAPEPEPVEPNPKAFKMALMADPLFLQWQEDIPAIRREDLKLSAIADNWPLVQLLYNQLKSMILTPEGATAQWQALADAHAIPLEF